MNIYPKFKDRVEVLKETLSSFGYRQVNLNRSSPKEPNPYYDSHGRKGVHSDLMVFFKSPHTENSFGFGFYYNEVQSPFVVATFKNIESTEIRTCTYKNLEELKHNWKNFQSNLNQLKKTHSLSISKVEEFFLSILLPKLDNKEDQYKEIERETILKAKELQSQKEDSLSKALSNAEDYTKNSMVLKKELAEFDKENDFKSIEKAYKAVLKKRTAFIEKKAKDLKLDSPEILTRKNLVENEFNATIEKLIKNNGRFVHGDLRDHFRKNVKASIDK